MGKLSKKLSLLAGLCALCAPLCAQAEGAGLGGGELKTAQGPFTDDWKNIAENYKFPDWFRDAKFGIFIHWGVYSVPAFGNEWYPRNMYIKDSPEYKHHIATWGEHTKFGYKDFIPMFKAEKFDADEWAQLFKASGAKYVVPVAEHHDGFAMYDSSLNPWNAAKMGPKRDIIAMLKKAVESRGMVFGVSSHRAENAWFYGGGMDYPSDVRDGAISLYGKRLKERESYTEDWGEDFLRHTIELVDKYQPSLIWFDWTVNNKLIMPYFNKFLAHYYNMGLEWKKGLVVNTKFGYPNNIQVWDMERGKAGDLMYYPWQTDTSIGKKSWAYIDGEENKNPGQIIRDLVDIVSKNGNLLLNIGPRADGTITDEQKGVLLEIGKWLGVNGEAIYCSRPWKIYGEGGTESPKGSFSDNKQVDYTAQDLRFTTRGNCLYVAALAWSDEGKITVHSLSKKNMGGAKLRKVEMLGSGETVKWREGEDGLELSFPKQKPCDYAYVFKLSFDKLPGEQLESKAVK